MTTTKRYPLLVLLVFLTFFVISFITNILNPLLPEIIKSFNLSLALGGFLPASFFVAYLVSIPAGMLLERYREKTVMLIAFGLTFGGSLLFATQATYSVALTSLFLAGIGIAMLQVAINPLLRVAGGEEHFAFFSVMAQLIFGLASYLSPLVSSYLVTNLQAGRTDGPVLGLLASLVPSQLPWLALYWVFVGVTFAMLALLVFLRLPRFELKDDERAGAWKTHRDLLASSTVWLFFVAIFCYVGTEQGIANWMSQFLKTYHAMDPLVEGAKAVSGFWGLMMVGCLVGLLLLKLFDSRRLLVVFSAVSLLVLAVALFAAARVSYYAFQWLGFTIAVMWSIIFSLALNSVPRHHGSLSGILCTGIVGGAVMPVAIGWLGDRVGLRAGLLLIFLTLGYILTVGFWARPLVANATVPLRELLRRRGRQQPEAPGAAVLSAPRMVVGDSDQLRAEIDALRSGDR
jgi:fucose permease